jgi:hypothetical protein
MPEKSEPYLIKTTPFCPLRSSYRMFFALGLRSVINLALCAKVIGQHEMFAGGTIIAAVYDRAQASSQSREIRIGHMMFNHMPIEAS